MEPPRPPRPQDMCPGATFSHRGSVVKVVDGKHGDGDLRILVNGRPVSHQTMDTAIIGIYMAEERYLHQGKKGGDYYFNHLFSVMHWTRDHLGKPTNALYPTRALDVPGA